MARAVYFCLLFLLAQWHSNCFGQTLAPTTYSRVNQLFNRSDSLPEQIIIINTPGMIPGGGHIQGIQQTIIKDKRALVLSGSSATFSYYAVAYQSGVGYQLKDVRTLLPLPYNHAGGIQLCDSLLAIGVEDSRKHTSSKIMLFDISNPGVSDNAALTIIERRGGYKIATAGAVALTKAGNDYLLAVGDWNTCNIDFYRSNGKQPHESGFKFDSIGAWHFNNAGFSNKEWCNYQAIQFFSDSSGHLFLAATGRKANRNVMDVYLADIKSTGAIKLTKAGGTVFHCSRKVSFRFGGGINAAANPCKVLATQRKPNKKILVNLFR